MPANSTLYFLVTLNGIGYSVINIGHYLAMEPSLRQFGTFQNYALAAGYVVMSLYSMGFLITVPTVMALSWIYNIKRRLDGKRGFYVIENVEK